MDETISGTTISDVAVIERPPMPGQPPRDERVRVEADLTEEYVSVVPGAWTPWNNVDYLRTLPSPIDDLMHDFGTRLYDEDMKRDPQVSSTLSVLVLAALAEGVTFTSAVESTQPRFAAANKVLTLCDYCFFDNLRRPHMAILYELLEGALSMGHKAGEQIYEQKESNIASSVARVRMLLKDIKPKAHEATAFVVDRYNTEIGLVYLHNGSLTPVYDPLADRTTLTMPDGDAERPRVIPRAKFIIPTHKPKNCDPRGQSLLKSVYPPWWIKQNLIPQHLAFVARFAQPSVWAKLPKEARDVQVTDPLTNQVTSSKSIVRHTNEQLMKIKSGAAGTFIDTDVALLETKLEGGVIFESYKHVDRQIAKGILLQTLTTEESQSMARAASSVHQDVFGIWVANLRAELAWRIRNEVLKPLVYYNFGPEAAESLVPYVSLGDTEQQDVAQLTNSLANLANAQAVHHSQWKGVYTKIDMPQPDDIQWAQEERILQIQRDIKEQMLKAQLEALQSGELDPLAPPPGQPGAPPPGGGGGQQPAEDGPRPKNNPQPKGNEGAGGKNS